MKVKKSCFKFIMIGTLLSILSATFSQVHLSGLPKVDEILYKAYLGATEDVIVSEFLSRQIEWIEGPYRKDLYDLVIASGHKISPFDPVPGFDYIAINCRNYKDPSGEPNFPLNHSDFRLALSYIYGMDAKQADIYNYINNYYQINCTYAIGNPVPPAQEPWYDETAQMPPTNWTTAWTILQEAGYYINSTDNWIWWTDEITHKKVRDIAVIYPVGSLYWAQGPGKGFVDSFNEFVTLFLGAIGPAMSLNPLSGTEYAVELYLLREFDLICHYGNDLGLFVDWLYLMLHSDYTLCGISDNDFDNWTEIIITSPNLTEIMIAASNVQHKFVYELMPWLPMSSLTAAFCSSWRGGGEELNNIMSMPNFGPHNDWSWMAIHWNYSWPGGTLKTALNGEPTTLNPYTEETLYGWQMLSRAITKLLMQRPDNLTLLPFVAMDWNITAPISIPELHIVNGSLITFHVRQDVTWHDGYSMNAFDCVKNLWTLRTYRPEKYSLIWENLVYEEVNGLYDFSVYLNNTTSLYYVYHIQEAALLSPKHVLDVVDEWIQTGVLPNFTAWDPASSPYEELGLGPPPQDYSFMKQIVGCGPFVFDYYDRVSAVGRVQKYDEFFVSAPAIGSVVGDWRVNPGTVYPYKVLVQNIAAKNGTTGELASMTVGVKVYQDGVAIPIALGATLDPWDCKCCYEGNWVMPVMPGDHTIRVEVYEGSTLIHNYTHLFVATIREDVTTCSNEERDYVVDGSDMIRAARAFGTYVGHERWDSFADLNDDYICDGADLIRIARKFGWPYSK